MHRGNASNRAGMKNTPTFTHELISQRAHRIWEFAGKPEGRDTELWLQAENELRASAAESTDIDYAQKSDPRSFEKHPAQKPAHSTDYSPSGVSTHALHHHRSS